MVGSVNKSWFVRIMKRIDFTLTVLFSYRFSLYGPFSRHPSGECDAREEWHLWKSESDSRVPVPCFLNPCMQARLVMSCVWLFVTPWTIAHQASLSLGFCRQEYWSGLPFPSARDLPHSEVELASPALAGRFFTIWATREATASNFPGLFAGPAGKIWKIWACNWNEGSRSIFTWH